MASIASLDDAAIQEIRSHPALQPPHDTKSNFIDPPNNNQLAVAVISVCIFLLTILSLTRIYTRAFYINKARLEDYIGLISFPVFVAAGAKFATMTSSSPGLFVRQWNMRIIDFEGWLHTYIVVTTLYCAFLVLIKAAIILEWVYLFVPRATRNKFRLICYVMIGANWGLYITTICVLNFACTPRDRIWRRYLPGTCINTSAANVLIGSLHLIFDILMTLIPHRIIWTLSLSARQKASISAVFSVGIMTCVCAAGRLAFAVNMIYSNDKSYDYSGYLTWGFAECTTAGLMFCVPAVPVAFRSPFQLPVTGVRLRSKIRMIFSQNTSTTSSQRLSGPQASLRGATHDVAPWIDHDSVVNLTELEPVRTRGGCEKNQLEEDFATPYDGGILRTTEIAITTSENPHVVMSTHHQGHPQPWFDRESSD